MFVHVFFQQLEDHNAKIHKALINNDKVKPCVILCFTRLGFYKLTRFEIIAYISVLCKICTKNKHIGLWCIIYGQNCLITA